MANGPNGPMTPEEKQAQEDRLLLLKRQNEAAQKLGVTLQAVAEAMGDEVQFTKELNEQNKRRQEVRCVKCVYSRYCGLPYGRTTWIPLRRPVRPRDLAVPLLAQQGRVCGVDQPAGAEWFITLAEQDVAVHAVHACGHRGGLVRPLGDGGPREKPCVAFHRMLFSVEVLLLLLLLALLLVLLLRGAA